MTGPRKSLQERIEDELKRQEQVRAELNALKARAKAENRKLDTRRKIILGAAAMAHAREDREFLDKLRSIARARIVREQDLAVVRDFLIDGGSESAGPQRPEGSGQRSQSSAIIPS
jgi:phosphoenolpyruvate carboxylase